MIGSCRGQGHFGLTNVLVVIDMNVLMVAELVGFVAKNLVSI